MECLSNGSKDVATFKSSVPISRWTHIALVHYPHRASNPSIRACGCQNCHFLELTIRLSGLFVDGGLTDSVNWQYPRPDAVVREALYTIGDSSELSCMSWSIASAYIISLPLGMTNCGFCCALLRLYPRGRDTPLRTTSGSQVFCQVPGYRYRQVHDI